MKKLFKYFLHNDLTKKELVEYILYQVPDLDMEIEELYQKLDSHPFYQVTLVCELDTDTGKITLISAEL